MGNVVGGLANTLGHGAVTNLKETGETLVAAGGALAQGRIVTATAEIGTQAVRVVANTATGAAKLGVETVKNVASTLVTGVQGTLGKIEDTVDPIQLVAAYLQPVQARLASALIPLRGLRGVLSGMIRRWHMACALPHRSHHHPALSTVAAHLACRRHPGLDPTCGGSAQSGANPRRRRRQGGGGGS